MEVSGAGKAPNTSLSFRYNPNNEELEELFQGCEDDPPTPQPEPPVRSESASPKKMEKSSSIIDKYFKSMRNEKPVEKVEEAKTDPKDAKVDEKKGDTPKEVTSSPMKEYLNRLGKRSTSEVVTEVKDKESNETWKIFHDFKFKIAQAVEDMKTRSVEEKEKSLPRENSTDSEDNSAIKDSDQQSMGDTDNQVSSLDSSIQNLSDLTQPLTAKPTDADLSKELSLNKSHSESSDDTHKNLARSESDIAGEFLQDSLEVESGVEALEDTIDAFGDQVETDIENRTQNSDVIRPPPTPTNFGLPPSKNNLLKEESTRKPKKVYLFKFSMYLLTIFLIINFLLFPNCNIWNGFWLGIWFFCFISNVKDWVLDNYFSEWEPRKTFFQLKNTNTVPFAYTIPSVKEHRPLKKYEGWINHYRYPDYDPYSYHINKTTTAFMKLEGCNLRISYTSTKIAKRALWDEKIENITFYQHRLYNLTGARVIMLPNGLVKRRQWSKKYPICVILDEREKIQVLEKESTADKKLPETGEKKSKDQPQETESIETNTSPEKKKKFVWRRREKSISHNEAEPGKEGLRHRIVRKMHRDKKTDSTTTGTEPDSQGQPDKSTQLEEVETEVDVTAKSTISTKEDDEELDDNELTKIKEFLEETDLDPGNEGTAEGEWSIHVKHSKDKHSRLYLFARTGRDKHEWYRRLLTAVSEANASQDNSNSEEKSGSDTVQETKDGVELSAYKITEKDTVAFAKSKNNDTVSEGVTITTPSHPVPTSVDSYEKSFWPYLQKIIQVQNPSPDCECRLLPAEATWVNTVVARLMYDVMRDPQMIARVQNRIQRKLNTLKLPSFMSPLMVTELRLAGACPLLSGVAAPTCDARGLWLHANLRYDGGATITILTQINLMKLKEKNVALEEQIMETNETIIENEILQSRKSCVSPELKRKKPAIYDSDVEDSAESSSDDESPPVQPVDSAENMVVTDSTTSTTEGGSSKKKFLRIVDKIATNKYFQQVTDYKYVKRAMEGLSNTDIKLQLEVNGLEGRLAINLPPPPHDRLWIGFSTNPQLVLKARPAVGARALRFAHISNWIEQKLTKEFEKVLVLPNMEDFIIDVLTPTPIDFE
ncbi:testis-expressed protein 2 [Maniola jurtina]|uniref:testis-expressed protein 2 n=1 Tax=Maniola jurtina TaxID=191418 RepID=UPI001E68AAD5|nr:testis-expressed protein 2 [Maniola jurtina]